MWLCSFLKQEKVKRSAVDLNESMILSPCEQIPVHFEGVSISQWTPIPSETSCKGVTLFSGCCNATTNECFGSHCSRSDKRTITGRRRQGEKGRLVQSIKNSYPVFLVEWVMERVGPGEGRGGDGQEQANKQKSKLTTFSPLPRQWVSFVDKGTIPKLQVSWRSS